MTTGLSRRRRPPWDSRTTATTEQLEQRQSDPIGRQAGGIPPDAGDVPELLTGIPADRLPAAIAQAMSEQVATLVGALRADLPEPLQVFLGTADATVATGSYYTPRVPIGALWQVGAVAVWALQTGTVSVYLDDVAPDRRLAVFAVGADGATLTLPAMWLRESQRLVIVVTADMAGEQWVTVTGSQHYRRAGREV